ncbi:MAG: proton-conducting transporter membrane subunit [Actinomycetota bacterium]|jgi:NADH:ubiquinone oxidoreductase subunit 5 (subunit L)/multisubunit Na+/H+ antiporter MnhA subunit|nr:proton-conducting transporter membrane subunit [Actinomycetota bacterium]
MTFALSLSLLSPILGALLIGSLDRFVSRRVVVLASLLFSLTMLVVARPGAHVGWWSPDRLGWFLAVASLIMGLCVCHYAVRQFAGEARGRAFLAMALTIIGCVVSTDLSSTTLSLCLSWVSTSVFTVLLLRLGGVAGRTSSPWRRAAMTFIVCDLILLVAIASTYAFSHRLSVLSPWNDRIHGVASVLFVAGAMVAAAGRAGLTLRRSWVIDTVNAPTPASALLHAGVVNAGALLIFRVQGIAGSSIPLELMLAATCLVVLVTLAPRIHARVDLKGQLAASTVAQMSLMLTAMALGYPLLAFTHAVGHGLYKAGRFMSAGGAIDQRARLRRRRPRGAVLSRRARSLAALTLGVVAATWGASVGGDAPALMGVFGPAAMVVWWARSATPLQSVVTVWSGLALALLTYGAFVAELGRLLALSRVAAQWQAPWWSLGVLVLVVVGSTAWRRFQSSVSSRLADSVDVRSPGPRVSVPS